MGGQMIDTTPFLFYFLSFAIVISAVCVVLLPNPIHSALSLAGTMIGLGFIFFLLDSPFIAGVQLIVYAGAVMVLFVMVLMLFDLKEETRLYSGHPMGVVIKLACAALLTGVVSWAVKTSLYAGHERDKLSSPEEQMNSIKEMAKIMFTKYVFAFEALGVLLLVIAIGVVVVARSRGGTHARD